LQNTTAPPKDLPRGSDGSLAWGLPEWPRLSWELASCSSEGSNMLHLEEVEKTYHASDGVVRALAGVNLEVPAGQFAIVRGPSGSGKTTLLSLVGGLATPTRGRVCVADEDLAAMSPGARAEFRARRIGFVFQTFHLLPYLDVWHNVALAGLPADRAAVKDRARELLARFGLEHRLKHRPAELSTGECQRVAIARALLNRPSLLLADEPTGNLDSQSATAILDLIGTYHRDGGTVILVTHQEWVTRYAQRVILLREGRIVPD
jgi:putative ABC transport system ATP-binding protein